MPVKELLSLYQAGLPHHLAGNLPVPTKPIRGAVFCAKGFFISFYNFDIKILFCRQVIKIF